MWVIVKRSLALLVLLAALPLAAAPTSAPPAAAAIRLPFDPPLGTVLRYDFEMRSEAGGQQRQRLRSADELTYSRAADGGYLLHWVTRSISVEAPGPMQAVLEKVYGIGVGTPMLIAVTADGEAREVVNAGEIRALSDRMMTTMVSSFDKEFAALPAAGRAMVGKMMTALVDQQRRQSDAAFAESLLEGPRLMLPGLAPLVPGVPVTGEVEQPSPLGGSAIHFLSQVELRRIDAGRAEIVVSSNANPEDAKRAAAAFLAGMLASITDPAQRREAEAAIAGMGALDIGEEAVLTIALPSGVAEAVQYRKQVQLPGQPARIDTRSYVRAR